MIKTDPDYRAQKRLSQKKWAQNLLESGASIFEIKQMLGHDKIESTKVYLHVHIKLMRQFLTIKKYR